MKKPRVLELYNLRLLEQGAARGGLPRPRILDRARFKCRLWSSLPTLQDDLAGRQTEESFGCLPACPCPQAQVLSWAFHLGWQGQVPTAQAGVEEVRWQVIRSGGDCGDPENCYSSPADFRYVGS